MIKTKHLGMNCISKKIRARKLKQEDIKFFEELT